MGLDYYFLFRPFKSEVQRVVAIEFSKEDIKGCFIKEFAHSYKKQPLSNLVT